MSIKEIQKLEICSKLEQKLINQAQDANILNVITRQVRRLFKAYKSRNGALALVSKKRGKKSNHQLKKGLKSLILSII